MKQYNALPSIIVSLIIVIAFVGFVDASYLTVKKYFGSPLTCYFFSGCDEVSSSPYSYIYGIPLSLFGTFFYLGVILSSVWYLQIRGALQAKLLFFLTTVGFIFSIYTFSLQAFVIKAFCFYCVVSFVCSVLNFLLLSYGWKRYVSIPAPAL